MIRRHPSVIGHIMFRIFVVLVVILAGGWSEPTPSYASVSVTATGAGAAVQVTPSTDRVTCAGPTCTYQFPVGTRVTLRAKAGLPQARLATWQGACSGSSSRCRLTASGALSVAARFTPVAVYTDQQTGSGTVSSSPPGTSCDYRCSSYPFGTVVTLTATPAPGYAFARWSGPCAATTAPVCRLVVEAEVDVSPVFVCTGDICSSTHPLSQDVKTVLRVSGKGYLRINGKACRSTTCDITVKRGTTLALQAVPNPGAFRKWDGSCKGSAPLCQLWAFKDASGNPPSVTARFG